MDQSQDHSKETNNLNEFDRQMCQYFIDFHKRLQLMEDEMTKTFTEFNNQIKQLSPAQQIKYEKYQDIMDTMANHYGEGDWPKQTSYGNEFGSHYLGLHYSYDPSCVYCEETRDHNQGFHKNNDDEYCAHCKEERSKRQTQIQQTC
jgi:hypothetical protein